MSTLPLTNREFFLSVSAPFAGHVVSGDESTGEFRTFIPVDVDENTIDFLVQQACEQYGLCSACATFVQDQDTRVERHHFYVSVRQNSAANAWRTQVRINGDLYEYVSWSDSDKVCAYDENRDYVEV